MVPGVLPGQRRGFWAGQPGMPLLPGPQIRVVLCHVHAVCLLLSLSVARAGSGVGIL